MIGEPCTSSCSSGKKVGGKLCLSHTMGGDGESDTEISSSEVYWYQPLSSIAGWLIYLLGAILYQVANVANMFEMEEAILQKHEAS